MICNQCDNDAFEDLEDGFNYCLQCGAQSETSATPNHFVLSVRKSSRIGAEEDIKKTKKMKKTNLASPVNNQNWSDEDELVVLKKLVDFWVKSGKESGIDWDAFYTFIGSSVAGKFSKKQVFRKIRELRKKYLEHCENLERENDPKFTKCTDSLAFGYSVMLWGLNETERDPEILNEHNEAAKLMENDTAGKETEKNYDELGFLRDAFDSFTSSGLSDHRKKLQLKNLMNLGAATKRQLNNEWRAICAEKTELKIQKFRFSAVLAEAAETVTKS